MSSAKPLLAGPRSCKHFSKPAVPNKSKNTKVTTKNQREDNLTIFFCRLHSNEVLGHSLILIRIYTITDLRFLPSIILHQLSLTSNH